MIKGELDGLLEKLLRAYSKYMQEELARVGITPGQPRMLNYLYSHDGCIQKELSENCNLKPSTVTNILLGMEKADLVFRLNDSSDRRILRVFITEKGVQAKEKVTRIVSSFEKRCMQDFTEEQKATLQIELSNLLYNLNEKNPDHNS